MRPPAPPPRDDREDPITRGLKRLFDEVASEPLPDEFLKILDEIDEQRSSAQRRAGGPEQP